MPLPKFLQSALWSYNLKELDIKKDKSLIITQVLNHGTWESVKWVCKNYEWREIKKVVVNPQRGCWHKDSLNYWLEFFKMKLPKDKYEKALFSLEVR